MVISLHTTSTLLLITRLQYFTPMAGVAATGLPVSPLWLWLGAFQLTRYIPTKCSRVQLQSFVKISFSSNFVSLPLASHIAACCFRNIVPSLFVETYLRRGYYGRWTWGNCARKIIVETSRIVESEAEQRNYGRRNIWRGWI